MWCHQSCGTQTANSVSGRWVAAIPARYERRTLEAGSEGQAQPLHRAQSCMWPRGRGAGQNVGSIIPKGFEAYTRIFHPAWKHDPQNETTVRWSEIAAANG